MIKKIYIPFLTIALALFMCVGCSDNGLEPQNYDRLTPENFPQSDGDIEAALTAIYNDMGEYWAHRYIDNSQLIVNELPTDMLISAWGGGWQEKDRFLWTQNTGFVKSLYFGYSKAITKATLLLDLLNKSEIANEELKNRFIAEARTLRAYFALQLLDLYGPVPIITDVEIATDINTIYEPARPERSEIISFIETELTAAAESLPVRYDSGTDYGRLTKGAALTMLMKMHLLEKNFAKVEQVTSTITGLGYSLLDSYNDVFSTKTENNDNKEVILAIPKIADGYGTSWYAVVLPQTPRYRPLTGITVNIWGGLKTPWSVYDRYEEGNDDRLGEAMIRYYVDTKGNQVDFREQTNSKAIGASPKKYQEDPDHLGNFQGSDIIRYRYADVLLARAEALNELNGPTAEVVALVNEIRGRVNTTLIEETGWTKDSMRDFILDERGRELFCEGHRRQDLIRHGKFIETAHQIGRMDAADHHVLYPLPQALLDENSNVQQNPGY
ncbi:RagB/SusD family nutrient uptake outer membrane protein [Prolixibacteraceae bacterium JC049]|nr:RagB/SusD family nutrient uptake outer membrane protein [Prolixibacteraceae bacterium JC049]